MKCSKCGFELNNEDVFCRNCGEPVPKNNASVEELTNQESVGVATETQVVEENASIQQDSIAPTPVVEQEITSQVQNVSAEPVNVAPASVAQPINSVNVQSNSMQAPKKANIKLIIIGAIALVAVVAAVFIGISIGKEKSEPAAPVVEPTSDEGQEVVVNNTYKMDFDGYTFEIPNEIKSEVANNGLYLTDGNWITRFDTKDYSYDAFASNKDKLAKSLKDGGYKNVKVTEETISGIKAIIITSEIDGVGDATLITALDTNKTLFAETVKRDKSIPTNSDIQTIAAIIKTGTKASDFAAGDADVKNNIGKISKYIK